MKYEVILVSHSVERVFVEASNEEEAIEKVMDVDDREILDGSIEVESVNPVQ